MKLHVKRFLTLGLCSSLISSSLLSYGQDHRLERSLNQTISAQLTTTQKRLEQTLYSAFEYPDIIQAIYKTHDFYLHPSFSREDIKNDLAPLQPDRTAIHPRPVFLDLHPTNEVIEKISKHTLTPEGTLDYIAPFSADKNTVQAWENTLYASMYLNNVLNTTARPYDGLERFLRHAQMRVAYRLSSLPPQEERTYLQTQVIAQLRLNLAILHIAYKRLYGQDALENVKGPFPFPRQLDEVTVTAKASGAKQPVVETPLLTGEGKRTVYDVIRANFWSDILGIKEQLPKDRYSFTKFVQTIKGRNHTRHFDPDEAASNIAGDFFWVSTFVALGKLIFGDDDAAPLAQLSALVPAAVNYELLFENFGYVKKIVHVLEPEKLAENKYGAIFKNDQLYQNMQPAMLEVFNALYAYAATPGISEKSYQTILMMLADFADAKQYSIMTRLAAISVAAKLISTQQEAEQKSSLDNASEPISTTNGAQKVTHSQVSNKMAQSIVDIYATLTAHSTLAGLQDYGLNATQMQRLADELARLYNIFSAETQGRYPRILPQGQEYVEEVRGFKNGIPVKTLHRYGAKAYTSWGEEVELFSHVTTNPAKYQKDMQENVVDLAVAVCQWKAMVGVFRLGKAGLKAVARLVLPEATAIESVAEPLTLQAAVKPGVQADDPAFKLLQYIWDNPVPEITSREELIKFLKLEPTVSDKTIKQTLRQLSIKYHPDRVSLITSAEGNKFVTAQSARLNHLREVMDGKGFFVPPTPPAPPAPPEPKTRFEKIYVAAEELASKEPYRVPDPHSWGQVARTFAGWAVADYALSFVNTPVEEKRAKDAQKEINQKKAKTDEPEPPQATQFLSDLATREVTESDGTVYQVPYSDPRGASIRLPINGIQMLVQSSPITSTQVEQLQVGHMNWAYSKAEKQGNIVDFKNKVTEHIKNMETEQKTIVKENEQYLAALPTGKKDLKTTYQTYLQQLKRARMLAEKDLPKATEFLDQATKKFAHARAQILVNGVKELVAQKLPAILDLQQFQLRWKYPDVLTQQALDNLDTLATRLLKAREQMLIEIFEAIPKALETAQEPNLLQQAAYNRFKGKETVLQAQTDAIYKQLEEQQHKIDMRNRWTSTVANLKQQLEKDGSRMYPAGIADYPLVKQQIDTLLADYVQELRTLLETATKNEQEQLMSDEENYKIFVNGVLEALSKRNAAFDAIKKDLEEQGITLFADPQPEQPAEE